MIFQGIGRMGMSLVFLFALFILTEAISQNDAGKGLKPNETSPTVPSKEVVKSDERMPDMSATVNYDFLRAFQGPGRDALLSDMKETAIAYLMVAHDPTLFHWLGQLVSEKLNVFVFVDRPESSHIYRNKQGVYVVSVDSAFSFSHGYTKFGTLFYISKEVTSWDKALFFFNKVVPSYKFVWILESDVFIPSLPAFRQVHQRIVKPNEPISTDLVIPSTLQEKDLNQWHWRVIKPLLPEPWYHSMACALGMSRRMLQLLDDFATKHRRLQFLEYLPLTLAIQNNLTKYHPPEFETVTFNTPYSCENVLQRSTNWFHPVKQPGDFIGRCLESGEWPIEMLKNRGHRD